MSIARPKRATTRKPAGSSAAAKAAAAAKPPKWKDVVGDQPDGAFAHYVTSATYKGGSLIAHPKFGKGIVLEVDGHKIHILFEEGMRRLLHGTPPS
jgi:hypothetical protein